MFLRDIEKILPDYMQFPALVIQGPRQAGKTFFAQMMFKKHLYTSFEDPDTRSLAKNDPRRFLQINENQYGIIIDEFQYVPEILSYLQLEIDAKDRPGYFILTGSQNFLMNQAVTQTLAGRVGILTLSPMSLHEISSNALGSDDIDMQIFNGGYPRLFAKNIQPSKFYPPYIQTYVERDVRQLVNVGDLHAFQQFIGLCAGRVGQLLNLSEIGGVCGISQPTARSWISILEASYILFFLQPYSKNYSRRLTKSPKLYFYDSGLICSLLGIESHAVLAKHPLRGNIFENFIIADLYKQYLNQGRRPPLYFWRDLNGRLEVDCIIDEGGKIFPVEIKSSTTVASDFFYGINQWSIMAGVPSKNSYIIYGGSLKQERSAGNIVGWKAAGTFVADINKES
jgi:predicted AAA+ superfamily ATPase